jgi:hypothetical protein
VTANAQIYEENFSGELQFQPLKAIAIHYFYVDALLHFCFNHNVNRIIFVSCCSVTNCRTAMEIARREFQIPMVLEPEYLASPFLDELSGMTYLSYFMKEDSPGFHATLCWVNNQIPDTHVRNFTVSNLVTCNGSKTINAEYFWLGLSGI